MVIYQKGEQGVTSGADRDKVVQGIIGMLAAPISLVALPINVMNMQLPFFALCKTKAATKPIAFFSSMPCARHLAAACIAAKHGTTSAAQAIPPLHWGLAAMATHASGFVRCIANACILIAKGDARGTESLLGRLTALPAKPSGTALASIGALIFSSVLQTIRTAGIARGRRILTLAASLHRMTISYKRGICNPT